jgi:translation initiation factor IF-1
MLFGETVAVYCENHMEHTDTLVGRMRSFGMLKQVVYILTTGV